MNATIHYDRKGERGYRIRKAFGETGELGYLQSGPNVMPVERLKAILASPHHQPINRLGKPSGKVVTYGEAWGREGDNSIRVEWPEPDLKESARQAR